MGIPAMYCPFLTCLFVPGNCFLIPWKRAWQPTPILAWRILWTEEPWGGATVHSITKSWTWLKQPSTHTQHDMSAPPWSDSRLCPESSPACFSGFIYLSSKVLIIFPCTLLICSLTAFVYDCPGFLPHPWSTRLAIWDSTVAPLLPGSLP